MRALIGIVKQRLEPRQMGQPSQDNRAIRLGPNPRASGLAGLARRGARRSSVPSSSSRAAQFKLHTPSLASRSHEYGVTNADFAEFCRRYRLFDGCGTAARPSRVFQVWRHRLLHAVPPRDMGDIHSRMCRAPVGSIRRDRTA
jgi:hypothetical protein